MDARVKHGHDGWEWGTAYSAGASAASGRDT
jgi:hypothetical protein